MRSEGFYWVRLDIEDPWGCAEFVGGLWFVIGAEDPVPEHELDEIGPAITPPKLN